MSKGIIKQFYARKEWIESRLNLIYLSLFSFNQFDKVFPFIPSNIDIGL